ncbi:Ger(x)C family spore germination protein [Clostridium coskatii]|uniref:Spore germination protein A3 n=1 Tax=Clostridium coskatii TaxID=1705578 RepID=A0A162JEQ9_9CLOT|nr:Ger(x)C family spore germination protein [Clostridium coskatii]OAA94125.1 Spore germination protein A3 precursor [Clostridium coskatii]OBR96687.1 spore germination protein A3 precursor [Clostridium coskatii]
MKKNKFFILILIILIFVISFMGTKGELVENLQIPVGVGADIEKTSSYTTYIVPILMHSFESGNKIVSNVLTGKGSTVGRTRENRQLKSSKKFLLGINRIYIFSEEASRNGIKNFIDIILNNANTNDRAFSVVCKGKVEDIFKYNVKGYASSAEYIYEMVKNSNQFNFFPSQYTIMDIIVRIDAEGRNTLLPYIEITGDKNSGGGNLIKTTGVAIFNKDKMIAKTDVKEAKIINLLKESNVKGILTLQQNSKKYTDFYATSKRKVKCYKENGKYNFIINLDLKGTVIDNELYNNMYKDLKETKEFEQSMESSVKEMCDNTINKIKSQYKVDVLDLGRVAAAKYGRETGTDWNEVISNSNIQVNVKVKVDSQGRGDY